MRISDLTAGKAELESLAAKRKEKLSASPRSEASATAQKDTFDTEKRINQDVMKASDLQKSFQRSQASMSGLNQLKERMEKFQSADNSEKNYEELTRDLHAIVTSTKYAGENVISYLSTSVKDDKSLYIFNSNLQAELEAVRSRMGEERKQIASFLVKSENLDAVRQYSPEQAMKQVVSSMKGQDLRSVYKPVSNINNLLS